MSEILTKEQIDQLLSGSGFTDAGTGTADAAKPVDESLRKVGELFCQQASVVLTTGLSRKVSVTPATFARGAAETLRPDFTTDAIICTVPVSGESTGSFWLLIGKKITATAADLMLGQEPTGVFNADHLDAITEITSQCFSSFSVAYATESGKRLQTAASKAADFSIDSPPGPWDACTIMTGRIAIEGGGDAPFALLIENVLGSGPAAEVKPIAAAVEPQKAGPGAGFVETRDSPDAPPPARLPQKTARTGRDNIDLLLDIDLDVSIELGNSMLSIKRVLELAPGSIIELDRMAGEPVDLLVNDKVVAKGEVVVIDESFGIRILSLVSPEERIRSLR